MQNNEEIVKIDIQEKSQIVVYIQTIDCLNIILNENKIIQKIDLTIITFNTQPISIFLIEHSGLDPPNSKVGAINGI
jgi:hypothetical protein